MTLARRVAALEASLTPTQLVLRWLDEAHAYGSLTAYVAAMLENEPQEVPLDRLCREAMASARIGIKGRSKEQTDAAVRGALQQAVFRFELVMRINVRTHEVTDRQMLVNAVLCGHLAMLSSRCAPRGGGDPPIVEQLTSDRDLAIRQVIELHAFRDARALAETRYLDGHPAVFPADLRAWDELVTETERLTVMADRLAEVDGAPGVDLDMTGAVAARAAVLFDDFVEPAKATALEKLGLGERAARIAASWVRARVAPVIAPPGSTL